jgi:hypothetical protein
VLEDEEAHCFARRRDKYRVVAQRSQSEHIYVNCVLLTQASTVLEMPEFEQPELHSRRAMHAASYRHDLAILG